jgi:uncharacterized protein YbjQ (UPF0145 family)
MLPNSLYLRPMKKILITTTPTVENRPVREYLGIVSGEALVRRWWLYDLGAFGFYIGRIDFDTKDLDTAYAATPEGRVWRDFKANLHKARDWAIHQMAKAAEELGANAVIGVKIDYKTVSDQHGSNRAMLVIATGTAVRL